LNLSRATVNDLLALRIAPILAQWPVGDTSPRMLSFGPDCTHSGRLVVALEWESHFPRVLTILNLRQGPKGHKQRIRLFHRPMPNGGYQAFAVCPGCRQLRRALYFAYGLRCRECLGLTYRSCQESHAFDRVAAIIGFSAGVSGRTVLRVLKEDELAQKHERRIAARNERRRLLRQRQAERARLSSP
jgi:hypothetical protein